MLNATLTYFIDELYLLNRYTPELIRQDGTPAHNVHQVDILLHDFYKNITLIT